MGGAAALATETRNKEVSKLIAAIHGESRGTYG